LNWTPNTSDAAERRYRFGQQPQMAHWNLGQLANAIYPLIGEVEPLQEAWAYYSECLQPGMEQMMMGKLGLNHDQVKTDDVLLTELSQVLSLVETDMTIFYRQLAQLDCYDESLDRANDNCLIEPLIAAYYQPEKIMDGFKTRIADWIRSYRHRVSQTGISNEVRQVSMNAVNPNFVLRNYLAQLAIDKAEQGDFSGVNELLEVLRHPYDEQPTHQHYAEKRPDWARQRAGCSMLSCSS
ncbi:MAG: YdiU family protein, partial [Methylococcales bacterium]|nr:YdiU family protein [Methylococcales bacterium]